MNGKNFLVLNNIDIIRKAFESDEIGALMSDRPLNFIGENIFFGYKDVLLRRYDDEFMKMKKLMIRSMKLHDYNSDKFQQLMSEELSHILSKFQKTEGKPTEPMDILVPSFCNIIGMLVSRSNLSCNTLWSLCIIHCPLSSISLLCNVYWWMASLAFPVHFNHVTRVSSSQGADARTRTGSLRSWWTSTETGTPWFSPRFTQCTNYSPGFVIFPAITAVCIAMLFGGEQNYTIWSKIWRWACYQPCAKSWIFSESNKNGEN